MYKTLNHDLAKHALKNHHIKVELGLIQDSMTVKTIRKIWDPYIILKITDLIQLLAKSLSFEHATKVLKDDELSADIIRIIELLTSCYPL